MEASTSTDELFVYLVERGTNYEEHPELVGIWDTFFAAFKKGVQPILVEWKAEEMAWTTQVREEGAKASWFGHYRDESPTRWFGYIKLRKVKVEALV